AGGAVALVRQHRLSARDAREGRVDRRHADADPHEPARNEPDHVRAHGGDADAARRARRQDAGRGDVHARVGRRARGYWGSSATRAPSPISTAPVRRSTRRDSRLPEYAERARLTKTASVVYQAKSSATTKATISSVVGSTDPRSPTNCGNSATKKIASFGL